MRRQELCVNELTLYDECKPLPILSTSVLLDKEYSVVGDVRIQGAVIGCKTKNVTDNIQVYR